MIWIDLGVLGNHHIMSPYVSIHPWLPWLLESAEFPLFTIFLESRTLPQKRSAWLSLSSSGIGEAFRPPQNLVCERNGIQLNRTKTSRCQGRNEVLFNESSWLAFDKGLILQ